MFTDPVLDCFLWLVWLRNGILFTQVRFIVQRLYGIVDYTRNLVTLFRANLKTILKIARILTEKIMNQGIAFGCPWL